MSDRVEREASIWALRHPLSSDESAALEDWLAQDGRHPGALLRAQATLALIDLALPPVWSELPATSALAPHRSRRWVLAGAGSAAAAAVAGLIGLRSPRSERIMTARGEIRRLPLADGSIATIDTESELRFALTRESRRIAIAHGQAWFHVAKDRTRPFIVDAGIAQVHAVGTAFAVSRADDRVEIAVSEGTVVAWSNEVKGSMSILREGQYAHFTVGRGEPETGTAPADINRSLAWRDGEISLEGEPLSYAIAQFNRYNRQQLILNDATLANERLVGLFKIGNPADFALTLKHTFGVSVTETSAEIRIGQKKSVVD